MVARVRELSKEQISQLPKICFSGTVHLVDSPKKLRNALDFLNKETLLGFDTESKPVFQKGEYQPPCLVQLATLEDAFVIQLAPAGGLKALLPILSNGQIKKIGVALHDDVKELRTLRAFSPRGFHELKDTTACLGITKTGLRNLVGSVLKAKLSKSAQSSNWARRHLDEKQLLYAATDAWAALAVYVKSRRILES